MNNIFDSNMVTNNIKMLMPMVLSLDIDDINKDSLLNIGDNRHLEVVLGIGYLNMLMDNFLDETDGEIGGLVLGYSHKDNRFYFELIVRSSQNYEGSLDYTMKLSELNDNKDKSLPTTSNKDLNRYDFYKKKGISKKVVNISKELLEGLNNIESFLNNHKDFSVWWLLNNHKTLKDFYDFYKKSDVDDSVITKYSGGLSVNNFACYGIVINNYNRSKGGLQLVVNSITVTAIIESNLINHVLGEKKIVQSTHKSLKV